MNGGEKDMDIDKKTIEKLKKVKDVSSKIICGALEVMESDAKKFSQDSQKFGADTREKYACMADCIGALREKFDTSNFESTSGVDDNNISYLDIRNRRVAFAFEYMDTEGSSLLGLSLAGNIIMNSPIVKDVETDLPFFLRRHGEYTHFLETGEVVKNWRGKPERDIMGNPMMVWRDLSALDKEFIYKLMHEGECIFSFDCPSGSIYEAAATKMFSDVMIMGNSNYDKVSNVLTGTYTEKIAKMEFGIWADALGVNIDDL